MGNKKIEWDEDTQALLKGQDSWVGESIAEGIKLRSVAKAKKDECDTMIREANTKTMPVMVASGVTKATLIGVGSLAYQTQERKTIQPDVLKDVLLKYLKAKEVAEVINQSTKTTVIETLVFRLPKKAKP